MMMHQALLESTCISARHFMRVSPANKLVRTECPWVEDDREVVCCCFSRVVLNLNLVRVVSDLRT